MTAVEIQGRAFPALLTPSAPLLLSSIFFILLVFISSSFGAPPLVQQPPRGARVSQLDPGRRQFLPQALQETLGVFGMDGKAGPLLASDSGLDSETRDSSSEWETVLDPRLYVITEYADGRLTPGSDSEFERRRRNNGGPSLSIVNPLDVLRQRLLFEIARRRMKQSHSQIIANNEILRNIGKK